VTHGSCAFSLSAARGPETRFFFSLLWFYPVHSLSLSLFSRSSDGVKRGDGGGAMAGRGLRLFSPEATEAVEWVLRHFFLPN
jgi:hypothetical protein